MMSYEFFNYITWGILRYHKPIFFIENRGNILPWLGTEHIAKQFLVSASLHHGSESERSQCYMCDVATSYIHHILVLVAWV